MRGRKRRLHAVTTASDDDRDFGQPPAPPPEPINPVVGLAQVMQEQGRVVGFERLRDTMLDKFVDFCTLMQPYAVLKLAIETDKHALFARMAEMKATSGQGTSEYTEFQRYLQGEIDVAPNAGTAPRTTSTAVSLPGTDISISTTDDGAVAPEIA